MSEQLPVAADVPSPHPIHLVVTDDLRRSRLTVFFRIFLVIPHLIWLVLWGIAVWFAVLAAWLIGIFTGDYKGFAFPRFVQSYAACAPITADVERLVNEDRTAARAGVDGELMSPSAR